jgi:hypothetical protein
MNTRLDETNRKSNLFDEFIGYWDKYKGNKDDKEEGIKVILNLVDISEDYYTCSSYLYG